MKGMEKYVVTVNLLALLFVMTPAFAQIEINDIDELQLIGNEPGYPLDGDYTLGNDIDASATSTWNSGQGFIPIANITTPFTGSLDGQDYIITGLTINRPSENYIGLLGYVEGAVTIQNVILEGVNVSGKNRVGSLVGSAYNTSVMNCYSTGAVSGDQSVGGLLGVLNGNITNCYNTCAVLGNDNYVGGLVGFVHFDSNITNCYSTGTVSGNECIGGLLGYIDHSYITNCYSTGTVSGDWHVGGLVGNGYRDNSITSCYSTGAVSGNMNVGGLVGYAWYLGDIMNCYSTGAVSGIEDVGGLVGDATDSNIINCYSTGVVSGDGVVGGLMGRAYGDYTIESSYWNIEISGQATSAGGEGRTTSEMMISSTYFLWNFSTIWGMPCDGSSYPYLLSIPPDPLMAPVNVTIEQDASQDDPTDIPLIVFDVTFDTPVTDFDGGDLDFTGSTALIADATATNIGDNLHYTVEIIPSTGGTITVTIPAGTIDLCGIATNTTSSSLDNSVVYSTIPEVPVAAWPLTALLLATGIIALRQRRK